MDEFSELSGFDFLQKWHARFPGATAAQFAAARLEGSGRSSYELLVDDVASCGHQNVLDVACGDGYLLELLADRVSAARLTGIDASAQELAMARGRRTSKRMQLVQGRADRLPFESASFDAATCHMALMLFDDARTAVKEIARVLRPGATFAAILGPAPGTSDAVRRFGRKLNELERANGLAALNVGDPAVSNLRSIFKAETWASLTIEPVSLEFSDGEDQVRSMLMGMYNTARLSDEAHRELSAFLSNEFERASEQNVAKKWTLGLCHLVARRG